MKVEIKIGDQLARMIDFPDTRARYMRLHAVEPIPQLEVYDELDDDGQPRNPKIITAIEAQQ